MSQKIEVYVSDYDEEEEEEVRVNEEEEKEVRVNKEEETMSEEQPMSEEQQAALINFITTAIDKGLINLDELLNKENLKDMLDKIKFIVEMISDKKEIQEELKNPKEHPEHIFALCRLINFLVDFTDFANLGLCIIIYLGMPIYGPQKESKTE